MRNKADIYSKLGFTIALGFLAGTAYGQVPATNDTSDSHFNTGMGTGALGGPTPTNLVGGENTASGSTRSRPTRPAATTPPPGYEALYSNTTGCDNTASGS